MGVQGSFAFPMRFEDAFPHGAFATGVEMVRDFENSTKDRPVQARDKTSGELLWVVEVIDADPAARDKTVKVKIAAPVQPVLPEAMAGLPFRPVEFDGLTATPYIDDKRCRSRGPGDARCRGQIAYSLRAKAMRAPGGRAAVAMSSGKVA